MLVIILLLIIFLLYIFLYGAAKLYVKVGKSDYQYILWGLYAVTIITVLEIIFCIYLYANYRTKDGELGPRGYQGDPGPDGDKGKCVQDNCKKELLVIILVFRFRTSIPWFYSSHPLVDLTHITWFFPLWL